ncbi:cytochrome c oxidase subunit 5B, mitochondrial-like [Hetaerina americana]|uniref:cytochrome c oxidase subunit 5B, mitochondrial-like n=1 Tax=Hetaerina americana TaxID=62018 RepID=UPI003A7F312C
MAALSSRILSVTARRSGLFTSIRCSSKMMADPLEHATGLEKREMLANMAGNDDPYDMKVFKRGPGTKDCPTVVPSAFEARIVGCICEEDSASVAWMWLKQGEPKRCGCGYWFKLEPKKPI